MLGRVALLAVVAGLTLSGCSEARRALGYDKSAPDEFAVISRAPLSQPPDLTLRPPQPGAVRPQEGNVRDQAAGLLIPGRNTPTISTEGHSAGEKLLLNRTGADRANPNIRKVVNEETTSLIDADKGFTDKILFWQPKPPPGEPLDAAREQERLQQNAALGRAPTTGESPQIVRKKKGWLEGIF